MECVLMPATKTWFTWPTFEAFNTWETGVVQALNLPREGSNAATGKPAPQAQWTTAYTEVTQVAENDWRAPVEAWAATQFADGLGAPCDPPPPPEML